MDIVKFLFSGTNPATLAGLSIILIVGITSALRNSFSGINLGAIIVGGFLCAVNYVDNFSVSADGVKWQRASGAAIEELSKTMADNNERVSSSIDNLNSQVAAIAITQKELVEKVAAVAVTGPPSVAEGVDLKQRVDVQNQRLIELYNENARASAAIVGGNQHILETIKQLRELQVRTQ